MNQNHTDRRKKICLVSSSGGHYDELKMLKPLETEYNIFWVTEKTDYVMPADYYVRQTGSTDRFFVVKMMVNFLTTVKIFFVEKPDVVITTGTMVALPFMILSKVLRKKFIYIETFSRIYDGTRAGKFMYKYADLFLYQWETLKNVYPKGIFGGGLF